MLLPNGNLNDLFITGLIEIFHFYLYLLFILFAAFFSKKMPYYIRFFWSTLITAMSLLYVSKFDTNAELFISIMLALLLVVALYLIKLISFQKEDCIFLFIAFLMPRQLFNSSFTILGYGIMFLAILSVLLGYGKLKEQYLRGHLFGYYTSFIYLSLISFLFQIISNYLYDLFRYKLNSNPLMLIASEIALLLLLCCITFFLQKKINISLNLLNSIGNKYSDVNKYILYLCIITIIAIIIIPMPFVITRTSSIVLITTLSIFYIMLLIIQLAFIVLIYKIIDYKQTLSFMDTSHINEAIYYASLNENLDAMENLRHDIKNIFLTMGNFVERSKDAEMKLFYQEKIYPFATEELEKNYLFSQLYQIPSETLRAFLHLKIFQAHNMNRNIKLSIQIDKESFYLGLDIMDLTRILGILLDNAFEECTDHKSYVDIRIKNNNSLVSYIIKNTSCKKNSEYFTVSDYKSTKAGHSGLGLSIVDQILKAYPLANLNTYIDETFFIQSLNISNM